MAIEKMTFVNIKGGEEYLDEVLIRCARSGIFQPENTARLSEYSTGSASLLRNPYGALLIKIGEIAAQLGLELDFRGDEHYADSQPSPGGYIEQTQAYLDNLRSEYPRYSEQRKTISDEIVSYTTALEMLRHVDAPDINFDRLWANRFLKIRFGRLPAENVPRLRMIESKPYEFYPLESSDGTTWCLYVTAGEFRDDVDTMFTSLGFERLRIPDYVHGTAADAISFIQEGLVEERERLQTTLEKQAAFIKRESEHFLEVYTRAKFLHDTYDLRRFAVIIRGQFHVVGYVRTRESEHFASLLDNLPTVTVQCEPAQADNPIPVPVQLRNNWFVRPFEMFVKMYGSPSYCDIDPSPFVAYTYSLLFGMMFGDLGHGLCVCLLGLLLSRWKNMDLGRIMSRIGAASMVFGIAYGSIFGFEHLLDPLFERVFGLKEKPIKVMDPGTTNLILIAAIAIGAAVIIMVIVFNIRIGVKHRDFSRAVLSSNGVAGLVLYTSVLYAAVRILLGAESPLTTRYILLQIALPLVLIFLREPITHLMEHTAKGQIAHEAGRLEQSPQARSDGVNIPELFHTQFVAARFGRIPTESYRKLSFYQNEPFLLYPLKTGSEYIWCVYATATVNKQEIDAIFHDLYFEHIPIPAEDLENSEKIEAFLQRCMDSGGTAVANNQENGAKAEQPKTPYHILFPSGFGGFFIETFFELFEVVLSFITNTMSFLRVGGFILVHAGMMEVVFKLSEMVGSGASPFVIVVGNTFVMAMEGLIVGIQVLRLEFYEIFSRFYDAAGEPFQPFSVQYSSRPGG